MALDSSGTDNFLGNQCSCDKDKEKKLYLAGVLTLTALPKPGELTACLLFSADTGALMN